MQHRVYLRQPCPANAGILHFVTIAPLAVAAPGGGGGAAAPPHLQPLRRRSAAVAGPVVMACWRQACGTRGAPTDLWPLLLPMSFPSRPIPAPALADQEAAAAGGGGGRAAAGMHPIRLSHVGHASCEPRCAGACVLPPLAVGPAAVSQRLRSTIQPRLEVPLFVVVQLEVTGGPVRRVAARIAFERRVTGFVRRLCPERVIVCYICCVTEPPPIQSVENAAFLAWEDLRSHLEKKNLERQKNAAIDAEISPLAGREQTYYNIRCLDPPDGDHNEEPHRIPTKLAVYARQFICRDRGEGIAGSDDAPRDYFAHRSTSGASSGISSASSQPCGIKYVVAGPYTGSA